MDHNGPTGRFARARYKNGATRAASARAAATMVRVPDVGDFMVNLAERVGGDSNGATEP